MESQISIRIFCWIPWVPFAYFPLVRRRFKWQGMSRKLKSSAACIACQKPIISGLALGTDVARGTLSYQWPDSLALPLSSILNRCMLTYDYGSLGTAIIALSLVCHWVVTVFNVPPLFTTWPLSCECSWHCWSVNGYLVEPCLHLSIMSNGHRLSTPGDAQFTGCCQCADKQCVMRFRIVLLVDLKAHLLTAVQSVKGDRKL